MLDTFTPTLKYELRLCKVSAITPDMASVLITDYITGQSIGPVRLSQTSSDQHIPKTGDLALVLFTGEAGRKLVKTWSGEEDPDLFREEGMIEPGESSVVSLGGAYYYLDRLGNAVISSAAGCSRVEMRPELLKLRCPELDLKTDDGFTIKSEKDKVTVAKESGTSKTSVSLKDSALTAEVTSFGKTVCTIQISATGNIVIQSQGSIDVSAAGSILLGGKEGVVVAPKLPAGSPIADFSQLAVSSKLKAGL